MNNLQFYQLAEKQMLLIEELIEHFINDLDADIDCDRSGNVLTVEFINRNQMVINIQEPLQEIWLATKTGAFHFNYTNQQWLCTKTNRELLTMVKQECEKYHP